MTNTVTIAKIEDHEGHGICTACDRQNLRWIATLTDGTKLGTECAEKILGWKPAPKTYQWVADFTPVAEHTDGPCAYVMWQHKTGTQTRETRDAMLTSVGGVHATWQQRGWL